MPDKQRVCIERLNNASETGKRSNSDFSRPWWPLPRILQPYRGGGDAVVNRPDVWCVSREESFFFHGQGRVAHDVWPSHGRGALGLQA